MMQRKSLSHAITFAGLGINTGLHSQITLCPGTSGICWRYNGRALQQPLYKSHLNTTAATFRDETLILCIEHLFAALFFLGITDAELEVNGAAEIPFLDGSAALYYKSMKDSVSIIQIEAGISEPNIYEPVLAATTSGDRWGTIIPANQFFAQVFTDYVAPLGKGFVTSEEITIEMLLQARSFIRDPLDITPLSEATLRLKGLKHAIETDSIILWSKNEIHTSLRMNFEWRYHKLLDLVGDLFPVATIHPMRVFAAKPGHQINGLLRNRFLEIAGKPFGKE